MSTGKERLVATLNHQETDRIPRDLGATRPTSIVKKAYENLLEHLNVSDSNINSFDYGQDLVANTVQVSEEVQNILGVDVRGLYMGKPHFSNNSSLSQTSWTDEISVEWKNIGGLWTPEYSPLREDFSISSINNLAFPSGYDKGYAEGLREKALKIHNENKHGLVMHLQDIIVHPSQNLLGMEEWFANLILQKNEMHCLFEKIVDLRIEQAISILKEVGDLIDVVSQSDDLGTQMGPIISLDLYNEMILPYHKKYFEAVRKHTDAKIFLHSCGSVYSFIPTFIDLGITCLNPVQTSAKDMSPEKLKKEFGKDIVFWGGIDTQELVKIENKEKRISEIRRVSEILSQGGGFVLSGVHNMQANIPPELIVEIFSYAN